MVHGLVFRGRPRSAMKSGTALTISLAGPPVQSPRFSHFICVTATVAAFLVGVVVGVAIPLILLMPPQPRRDLLSNQSDGVPPSRAAPIYSLFGMTPGTPLKDSLLEEQESLGWKSSNQSKGLLQEGIYWGSEVEAGLPSGFSDEEVDSWRRFTRQSAVVRLQDGCGRMQNRMVVFENGSLSCCRYRQNFDQIQGEIFSFFLSRLLGVHNVPPSALGLVRAKTWQWEGVGNQLALAQWAEDRPVVLTKFIDSLGPAFIPTSLRESPRKLIPTDIGRHDPGDLREVAQWSDLIIFDYLTANLDRVVNNLYNMQWNPTMMQAPAHNLAKNTESGLLVFLDNESGLLHGYRLLDKYESFHAGLLQGLCVFRRSTADRIRDLVRRGDAGEQLLKMYQRHEPELQEFLPPMPEKSIKILNERLRTIDEQIRTCEKLYSYT